MLGTPAPVAGSTEGTARPLTYYWQALVCIFLFPPTGLVATAYSLLVVRREGYGDRLGALRASRLARIWCVVSVVVFVLALIGYASGLR